MLFICELDVNAVACENTTMKAASSSAPIQVELDIFSGREAPQWSLSPTEEKNLRQIISSLPIATRVEFPDNLGYRGLTAKIPDTVSGASSTLKAYNGIIRFETGSQIKFFTDTDRYVERLLVGSAKPHLSPDLYNLLLKEARLFN